MASEPDGLAAEQIDAPQAILHLPQEREPGRPITIRFWSSVLDQNSSYQVFVDRDPKGRRDDQGNPWATETRIAPFEFDNGLDECFGRPLGSWFRLARRREQHLIFPANEALMKFQQR